MIKTIIPYIGVGLGIFLLLASFVFGGAGFYYVFTGTTVPTSYIPFFGFGMVVTSLSILSFVMWSFIKVFADG